MLGAIGFCLLVFAWSLILLLGLAWVGESIFHLKGVYHLAFWLGSIFAGLTLFYVAIGRR